MTYTLLLSRLKEERRDYTWLIHELEGKDFPWVIMSITQRCSVNNRKKDRNKFLCHNRRKILDFQDKGKKLTRHGASCLGSGSGSVSSYLIPLGTIACLGLCLFILSLFPATSPGYEKDNFYSSLASHFLYFYKQHFARD